MPKIIVDSCIFINAFKRDSEFRQDCIELLQSFISKKQTITMPAHGWFEVWCSLKRISREDKEFSGPLLGGLMQYPIELIHIDADFILKYGNVDIPRLKAGDHIFAVVAYVNGYPLVTTDRAMTKVSKELGVAVYTPGEYLVCSASRA